MMMTIDIDGRGNSSALLLCNRPPVVPVITRVNDNASGGIDIRFELAFPVEMIISMESLVRYGFNGGLSVLFVG